MSRIEIGGVPPNCTVKIDGVALPVAAANLYVDCDSLPMLTVTVPVTDLVGVQTEGDTEVSDFSKAVLLALGWTPPAADGTKPAMSDAEFERQLRKWIRINPSQWEHELAKIMRRYSNRPIRIN